MSTRDRLMASKLPARFDDEYIYHPVGETDLGTQVEDEWVNEGGALGSGSFGVVWLQKCTTDRGPYRLRAVKQILKGKLETAGVDYTRELGALFRFSQEKYSSHFVQSFGWYESPQSIFIAMEYLELGDLGRYLAKPFPEHEAQSIANQLLGGLQNMHKNGYVHRDLKLANIFVVSKGPTWRVKIGDFGLSKHVGQEKTAFGSVFGTLDYLAPEVLIKPQSAATTKNYAPPVDIWALGVIVFRLLTGKLPFNGISHLLMYFDSPDDTIARGLRRKRTSRDGTTFVEGLLSMNPAYRPSAEEALSLSWFAARKNKAQASSTASYASFSTAKPSTPSARWSALAEITTGLGSLFRGATTRQQTSPSPALRPPDDVIEITESRPSTRRATRSRSAQHTSRDMESHKRDAISRTFVSASGAAPATPRDVSPRTETVDMLGESKPRRRRRKRRTPVAETRAAKPLRDPTALTLAKATLLGLKKQVVADEPEADEDDWIDPARASRREKSDRRRS
ncbi:kinase-like domain-containing protein [Aspergillus karnatakaensis]|uniref:serine/threonine-protein kinase n=1 Tax=Aspergillus karnatakaensis TaxID=1810916 RepID=UPI003CCCAAD5